MSKVMLDIFGLMVAFVVDALGTAIPGDAFARFNMERRSPMLVIPSYIRVSLSSSGIKSSVRFCSTNFCAYVAALVSSAIPAVCRKSFHWSSIQLVAP